MSDDNTEINNDTDTNDDVRASLLKHLLGGYVPSDAEPQVEVHKGDHQEPVDAPVHSFVDGVEPNQPVQLNDDHATVRPVDQQP